MANSQPLIGNDGEFLIPQQVPKHDRVQPNSRGKWWIIFAAIGVCIFTYLLRIWTPKNVTQIISAMAVGAIFFQISIIYVRQTALPIIQSKGNSWKNSRKSEIPSDVIFVTGIEPSAQPDRAKFPGDSRSGCTWTILILLTIASWLFLFNQSAEINKTFKIYTQGITTSATLDERCEQVVTSSEGIKTYVSYYPTFQYRTILAPPSGATYSGKYEFSYSECPNLPANTSIVIRYLPESPHEYRIVAHHYEVYDTNTLSNAISMDNQQQWVSWALICLDSSIPAIALAQQIYRLRKQDFISEHGEIIVATVVACTLSHSTSSSDKYVATFLAFEFLVHHPDGTMLSGYDKREISRNLKESPIKTGDKVALRYVDDRFYYVL